MGAIRIRGLGLHRINYDLVTATRAELEITIEGIRALVKNNHTITNSITGYEPCKEYTTDGNGSCKTGYTKRFQQVPLETDRKEYRLEVRNVGSALGANNPARQWTRVFGNDGEWNVISPNIRPNSGSSGSRLNYRITERPAADIPAHTLWFCTPDPGCRGEPIREDIDTNSGNITGFINVDISPTPSEQFTGKSDYVGNTARENTQDTKYRIISPRVIKIVNGKEVEELRYESVRFLSPGAVGNYTARGYEIQSVNPNTPASTSKPYGESVIKRSERLKPGTRIVSDSRRKRLTFSDISPHKKMPFMGNSRKRTNKRKVVS